MMLMLGMFQRRSEWTSDKFVGVCWGRGSVCEYNVD